jgi:hypothetical protein
LLYFAYHRDECLTSGPDLVEILDFVAGCIDPSVAEDAVIWQAGRVVAVVMATGIVVRFDSAEVPVRFAPAEEAAA